MNDSLVSQDKSLVETKEQSISRQFYEWERRGRGWQVYDYSVELEPPFRPFYYFEPTDAPIADDGRVPTFFSSLLSSDFEKEDAGNRSVDKDSQLRRYVESITEADEPEICRYYHADFDEIQLVLPNDLRVSKSVSEQLLLSMAYAANPISFEVIGTATEITIQFAATSDDVVQLQQQLVAYFPRGKFLKGNSKGGDNLSSKWLHAPNSPLIVDFGLSEDFMVPLSAVQNLEKDPLTAIVGAMSTLRENEAAIFQVLLQKARNDWPQEITDTIACFEGTGFFDYLPDVQRLAKQKFGQPLFAVVIRTAARSLDRDRSLQILRNIGGGLAQLGNPSTNELIPLSNDDYAFDNHERALLDRQSYRCGMLLNSEELVSLVHPPSQSVQTPKLLRDTERTKQAPLVSLGHTLELGNNRHNGQCLAVTLSNEQRTRHIHVVGTSGSGKSTLLLSLIKQDLERDQGLCVIDPHGDLIDDVLANVPDSRLNDVIFFDPSDSQYPIGLNILRAKTDLEKTILSSDLVATFRRMSTSWGDVMDSVLANAVLAIVESNEEGTLFDLKRFLIEKQFRTEFLKTVPNDSIRYFWNQEFPLIASKPQASILIRLDTFLRQKVVRNIVCQKESNLDFREIMDNRKVLLIKLSQGLIGEENSHLLGSLLVSKIYQAALSRQETQNRPYFWLYLDEFQHFITPSMESILSGSRKYHLGLTLSHQEFRQMQSRDQDVASSVLTNCYTRICFRLGDSDAEKFANGFSYFDTKSLQNLGIGECIARIERSEHDFNLQVPNLPKVAPELADQRKADIISSTREKYARPQREVEMSYTRSPAPVTDSISTAEASFTSEALIQDGRHAQIQNPENLPIEHCETDETAKTIRDSALSSPENTGQRSQHQYLQSLVKRMAEHKGFRVNVEKEVFGGVGRIDVVLEDELRRIACEISVTNEPEYELQNIRKCISSGYSPVIMISANLRHLEKIRQKAMMSLTNEHFLITRFFTPEEFFSWLNDLDMPEAKSGEKIKGFKVKVNVKPSNEAGQATRKRAISDVVFGALRRLKKKDQEK